MARTENQSPTGATKQGDTIVAETLAELALWRGQIRSGAKLGFVPTMGALHEGHMSLINKARKECDYVCVSIFVNPLQFGVNEDLSKYPRPFERDLEFCRKAGVDLIFHPSVAEIYRHSEGDTTTVVPPNHLISGLCGNFRPGHFVGVATIVLKLFNMVSPHIAYFGEKDYQQLMVVKKMVADFNCPIEIIGVPTGRDHDGLALSSRNVYLDANQRALAPILQRTLAQVFDDATKNGLSLQKALTKARNNIQELAGVTLEYLEACDADNLQPLGDTKLPMVILVAAKFGTVRLIDNIIIRN